MNFLADENVDRQIVERLRQDGHAVTAVAEMAPGIADPAVLAAANASASVLLTADKDFGEIVFRQRRWSGGIILIRLAGLSPEAKALMVGSVVSNHAAELVEAFTVVTRRAVRIRRRYP